jgi:hypothetical protein
MTDTTLLHPGDPFPGLIVNLPGGRTVHLPSDLAGRFGVVLFYRGSLVPVLQRSAKRVPAGTRRPSRSRRLGRGTVGGRRGHHARPDRRHGLRFPVGHSADAAAVADGTGAFVNPGPPFLQSTGFVLDPDGRVILSVYSSGAIGRLVPQDVIRLIGYLRGTQLSRQEAPHGTATA